MIHSYDDLKVNKIEDLKIPESLQILVNIMSQLVNNPLIDEQINQIFSEICELIDNTSINMLYILDHISKIFPKHILSYAKIYKMLKEKYKYDYDLKLNSNIERINIENASNIYPVGSVFYAVAWDKYDELVLEAQKSDFDVNQKSKDLLRLSLINIACKYGSEKCFKFLKHQGAEITKKTFLFAIEGGNINLIMTLYNDGFKIKEEHLQKALEFYHYQIFDWLLETKGSINEIGFKPVFYGNIPALLFLAENGFNLNITYWDIYVISPLYFAIEINSLELFRYLVDHGADIHKGVWNEGYIKPPLFNAIEMNSFEIVQFLVEKGADVNQSIQLYEMEEVFESREQTPLTIAIEMNALQIIKFLIDNGADIHKEVERGDFEKRELIRKTPLTIALEVSSSDTIQFLINHGADQEDTKKRPLALI